MTTQTSSPEKSHSSAAKNLASIRDFIKRHRNVILPIVAILLILLSLFLVKMMVDQSFAHQFSCHHLIDETLGTSFLCDGFAIPTKAFTIFGGLDFGLFEIPAIRIPKGIFPILPSLDVIDPPLDSLRRFVVWNIILAFAVVSLVLGFIAVKIKDFIKLVATPAGRVTVLTNVSLWLLIFAIFCGWFYFSVVANR